MAAVRLAIIGGGSIGQRHADAISKDASAQLVAVADPAPGGKTLAQDLSVPHYQTAEDLFANEKIDGVIVSTPTQFHFAPTMTALDAGAHVLVEKPIMATLDQAEQVVAKSAERDLAVLVGHHRRYYPQVHKAREIVQSGKLGKLIAVNGQWNLRKNTDYYDQDWRRKWQAGPVLTNFIHDMDCLRYICGEVESLSGEISHEAMNVEKEDAAAMVMRFKSGAIGTFIISDQTASPWAWEFGTGETPAYPKSGQNSVRFMGTDAALDFPNLVLWHHNSSVPDWKHAIERQDMACELTDAFTSQIAHFCAVIRGQEEPRITARDATDTLRATLAIFEAAKTADG